MMVSMTYGKTNKTISYAIRIHPKPSKNEFNDKKDSKFF